MNTGIRATSETLRAVLEAAMAADPILQMLFTGAGASVVSLANPDEMTAAGESGISVWLYRLVRDEQRLNAPPERIRPNEIRPTPLPIRLHYLIAPVLGADGAGAPIETRHHILGAVLQAFHERPLISGIVLAGDFAGTSVELAVRLESPTSSRWRGCGNSLESGYQLCVSYEVGIVSISGTAPNSAGPPVMIALPELGTAGRLVSA